MNDDQASTLFDRFLRDIIREQLGEARAEERERCAIAARDYFLQTCEGLGVTPKLNHFWNAEHAVRTRDGLPDPSQRALWRTENEVRAENAVPETSPPPTYQETALRVLEPLGFEAVFDPPDQYRVVHRGAGVTIIDIDKTPLDHIVHELIRIGIEQGVAALRRDLWAAIGDKP